MFQIKIEREELLERQLELEKEYNKVKLFQLFQIHLYVTLRTLGLWGAAEDVTISNNPWMQGSPMTSPSGFLQGGRTAKITGPFQVPKKRKSATADGIGVGLYRYATKFDWSDLYLISV